jgi:hypothetical protein
MTARTAALALQARNVALADVFEARRSHMTAVSRAMLGHDAETVIDLVHHQD